MVPFIIWLYKEVDPYGKTHVEKKFDIENVFAGQKSVFLARSFVSQEWFPLSSSWRWNGYLDDKNLSSSSLSHLRLSRFHQMLENCCLV